MYNKDDDTLTVKPAFEHESSYPNECRLPQIPFVWSVKHILPRHPIEPVAFGVVTEFLTVAHEHPVSLKIVEPDIVIKRNPSSANILPLPVIFFLNG